jgi:hypoxanthine-guanine phosphoribosyltransferase
LTPADADMNDDDPSEEIEQLEAQIDELAAKIESCRKFILAGQIAMTGGGVAFIAMLTGAIGFDPSVMSAAVVATFGGIVAAGSNSSTAKEATQELAEAEAKRATLIEHLNLRLVPNCDGLPCARIK